MGKAQIYIDGSNFPDENFRTYLLSQPYGADQVITYGELAQISSLKIDNCGVKDLTGIGLLYTVKRLECQGNELSSLDLSRNYNLEYLDCSGNKLTSLGISNCTELTILNCKNNLLTTLSIDNCQKIETLYCDGNQFLTLDASKNSILRTLSVGKQPLQNLILAANSCLNYLTCTEASLTSINLSQSTALLGLTCEDNSLGTLDLSDCTNLNYVRMYRNQVSGEGMDALIDNLPQRSSASLYVVDVVSEKEGNVCTTVQVENAKRKGWTVYYTDHYGDHEYSGSEPSAINPVTADFNTTERTVYTLGGRIAAKSSKEIVVTQSKKYLQK